VRGAWRIARRGGARGAARLEIEPFEPLSVEQRLAVTAEAERLVAFALPGDPSEVRILD
jgi:hypothetical protein